MSLELAPQTESRLHEYATAQHISTDEAINRLLRLATSSRPAAWQSPQPDRSAKTQREAIHT